MTKRTQREQTQFQQGKEWEVLNKLIRKIKIKYPGIEHLVLAVLFGFISVSMAILSLILTSSNA